MMDANEVTHGELVRLMASHVAASTETQAQIAAMASAVAVLTSRVEAHDRDIEAMEKWQTWALRLVVGLVIAAVLGQYALSGNV